MFAVLASSLLIGQLKPNQTGPIKAPGNLKIIPYKFKEPQPGYLSEFDWTGDIPMTPSTASPNAIDTEVIKAMKTNKIPGAAVVVMKDDVIIHSRGYGFSNLGAAELFTPTTPSRCGSISKTATGLMMLRAQNLGGLSLDDKLEKYFSSAQGIDSKKYGADKPGWDKIKLRDLIDHRSGVIGAYLPDANLAKAFGVKAPMSLDQYVFATRKSREPGGKKGEYVYNNLNFTLATYVLEHATQKPFDEALYWLLGQPLGIPRSEMFLSPTYGPDVPRSLPNKEARCYQTRSDFLNSIYKDGEKVPEAYGGLDGNILSGAGHIAFSANAIAKMVIALRTQPKSFLNQTNWNEITKNPVATSKDTKFYSKGTNYDSNSKTYSHGAMLMHAGGVYQEYGSKIQFVVIANSNRKINMPLVDQLIAPAVSTGIQTMNL